MLVGIVTAFLIPVLAGLALFFTDWAEATVVAPTQRPIGTE